MNLSDDRLRLRQFWRIGWPVSTAMALNTVLSLVDLGFVSTLGKTSIAGVGLVGGIIWLLTMLPDLFAVGVLAAVARAIGSGRLGEAGAAMRMGLFGAWVFSILLAIPCFIFAPNIVSFFNVEPAVAEISVSFFRILLVNFPFTATLMVINEGLYGAARTRVPLMIMGGANILNIILNPCLILGLGPFPRLEASGSATATLISTILAATFALIYINSRRSPAVPFGPRRGREGRNWLFRLMRVGSPAALQGLMRPLTATLLYRIVACFGTAAIASFAVGIRCLSFAFIFTGGLNMAASSLAGQSLGREDPAEAERMARVALRFTFFLQLAISLLYFFGSDVIMQLFNQTGDAQVATYGISYLQKIAIGFTIGFMAAPMAAVFRGSGDTAPPMIAAFFANWIVKLGLSYVISGLIIADMPWVADMLGSGFGLGLEGVWWAISASLVVEGFILIPFFRSGRWKHAKV